MKRGHLLLSLALGAAFIAANPANAEKSLYERLGGEPAITAVVDDFVGRAAADPKVDFTRGGKYDKLDVPKLKKQLVNLVGQLTGGPQKYTGKDMKTVHKGMKITPEQFDALAADLVASLDKFKVPAKEKGELLTIVGSTKTDMVEGKGPAKKKHKEKAKS
jgi:hemoglobin